MAWLYLGPLSRRVGFLASYSMLGYCAVAAAASIGREGGSRQSKEETSKGRPRANTGNKRAGHQSQPSPCRISGTGEAACYSICQRVRANRDTHDHGSQTKHAPARRKTRTGKGIALAPCVTRLALPLSCQAIALFVSKVCNRPQCNMTLALHLFCCTIALFTREDL
jgi:hypothetical protein